MPSCCHIIARHIFAMGLTAIVYGAVFGFTPRDVKVVKAMIDCAKNNVKRPETLIECMTGTVDSNQNTTSVIITVDSNNDQAFLINALFLTMVTLGHVISIVGIVFMFLHFFCCRGKSGISITANVMLGLGLPAIIDEASYLGTLLSPESNKSDNSTVITNVLNLASTYSGYVGISLAAGWLITCLIGPVMTRIHSICMRIVCLVIGLAAAAGLYCAIVLAIPPEKLPGNIKPDPTLSANERLCSTLIVAAFISLGYIMMFFICTCMTVITCCGRSD